VKLRRQNKSLKVLKDPLLILPVSPFTQFARDAGIVDEDIDVVGVLLHVVDKAFDALEPGTH